MLTVEKIKALFHALDEELAGRDVIGEIGICGGAVMCLVFQARRATKDVDAIFEPVAEIREGAKAIAERFGVPDDWLNDAAKAFFHSDPPRQNVLSLPHLRVWAPSAAYMLAMKCVSARFDTHDLDDTKFLIDYLGLRTPNAVFEVIEVFYPNHLVPAKTQFLVEELLSSEVDKTATCPTFAMSLPRCGSSSCVEGNGTV